MSTTFPDLIDRGAGNGSRNGQEDWIDENTTSGENRFSISQTTFYPDDAPPHLQQRYERLKQWHDDKWSSNRKHDMKQAMILVDAETFCSILDFSQHETERVKHIVEESDMSSNNFGGKPYEKVLLAICTLVSDENTENFDQRVIYHDKFTDLLEHIQMTRGEHKRLRQAVRERSAFKQPEP